METRIENLSGCVNALQAVACESVEELFADQHHAFAIFFVCGIIMRLQRAIESIENGNQIHDQPLDTAAAFFMAVALNPLPEIFKIGFPAEQCLRQVLFFRANRGTLPGPRGLPTLFPCCWS